MEFCKNETVNYLIKVLDKDSHFRWPLGCDRDATGFTQHTVSTVSYVEILIMYCMVQYKYNIYSRETSLKLCEMQRFSGVWKFLSNEDVSNGQHKLFGAENLAALY